MLLWLALVQYLIEMRYSKKDVLENGYFIVLCRNVFKLNVQ
jgi:hypothetical protein